MSRTDIYRDGKVHVLDAECASCIFRPAVRPVDGARVGGMVRDTMDTPGATVPCHSTLYGQAEHAAICRGWYDRLADRDPVLRLAQAMGIIEYDPQPEKG